MANRIKITEAISLCNASTGKPIKEIEYELRVWLWNGSTESAQKQNLANLKKGRSTKLSADQVQTIYEVTAVDANFLFEIN